MNADNAILHAMRELCQIRSMLPLPEPIASRVLQALVYLQAGIDPYIETSSTHAYTGLEISA